MFPEPVTLAGEYSVDGGPWRPLTENTNFDNRRRHTTTLRGHFSREIRERQSLLLYIRNLYLTLRIDGRDVYRFGDMDEPKFFYTPGVTLSEVELGRVGTEADVEIVITDAFRNTIPNIRALLDALALRDRAQLYERLIQVDGPLLIAGPQLAAVCLIPATLGGLAECIKYFIFSLPNSYFRSTVGFTAT